MLEGQATNDEKKNTGTVGSMPWTDIVFMTIRQWPWIIVSVIVCLGLATIYLLRTPTIYSRSTDVLIKDDTQGQSIASEAFTDFGLIKSNSNLANEMSTLKSYDLMEEVVKRLHLEFSYFAPGHFHDNVAYGEELPVEVILVDYPADKSASFTLNVNAKGIATISNIETTDIDDFDDTGHTYTGALLDTIKTSIGNIIVAPTAYYKAHDPVELEVQRHSINYASRRYASRLDLALTDEDGSVIQLSISDRSKQRADDVLNTLIKVYNENWILDKNQIAASTSNFINERLNVIEDELGHVDSDISSFKSSNLIPDIQFASSMYMTQNQQTASEILKVNNQLQMAKYIRNYLSADANSEQLLPANSGLEGQSLQQLISDYNNSVLQRNSLVARSSDKNPLVVTMNDQLTAQRKAIISTIDNQIVDLSAQLKTLQNSEAQTISRIASNPSQAKYLLSVERQQKVKEALYLFLLQKREENELSQAFTAYNTRIINRPGDAQTPPSPNRRTILMLAFLIGIAIPFIVVYIKETYNTKLRGRKDIDGLAIPFMGEIPQLSTGRGKRAKISADKNISSLAVKAGKRDVINEAFRVLRTNIELINSANSETANVIAITSFNPHSGKSFISVNLGKVLALKQRKVLVIDGDLRHGSTSSFVHSPSQGLSNYLYGTVTDIMSVIKVDEECPDLHILPIGTVPPNPTELLETPAFGQLIEQLRSKFDYIIIDCPPIEVVADAQIINKHVDRTIFVIRAHLLERSMIPELDKLYEQKRYKSMSLILNGTDSNQGRYGYSHGYRYGYGYGYGYGYEYGDKHSAKSKNS
jgi:capsular exopolysaccharide synthesis family protein